MGPYNLMYGGKWGYIDKTGKEVVPCKYDFASSFSDGLAAVNIGAVYDWTMEHSSMYGGKWGYIDKTGKEAVPLKYDTAYDFSDGLARVKLNGKCGFISISGYVPANAGPVK